MRLTDIGVSCTVRSAKSREQELKYTRFIACHFAISIIDHLGEMTAAVHRIKFHPNQHCHIHVVFYAQLRTSTTKHMVT